MQNSSGGLFSVEFAYSFGGVMRLACCLIILFSLTSCSRTSTKGGDDSGDRVLPGGPLSQSTDEPPTVRFDLKIVNANPASPTLHRYECTYAHGGKVAKFGLELTYGALKGKDLPNSAAGGKPSSVPGCDNLRCLEVLKTTLSATKVPG